MVIIKLFYCNIIVVYTSVNRIPFRKRIYEKVNTLIFADYINRSGHRSSSRTSVPDLRLRVLPTLHPCMTKFSCSLARVYVCVRTCVFAITKTYLYNFDPPLKPHFYIVKLKFAGVYIIFLISVKNIDCGYP